MERWGSVRTMLAFCVALTLFAAVPAGAEQQATQIEDPRGDANFWAHAFYMLEPQPDPVPDPYEGSPDTRPVSIEGADLVEAWYETEYETVTDRDSGGRIVRVRRVPTHLRVSVRMDGSPAPTFGPTVETWIYVTAGACTSLMFKLRFVGALSAAGDQQEARTEGSCVVQAPSPLVVSGDTASFTIRLGGHLSPGVELSSRKLGNSFGTFGHMASFASVADTWRVIDMTKPALPFVIGSDVPPDVDCVASSGHPECFE